MISFCKPFELKHSSGCLDIRLLEPGNLEFRLLLDSIGPTLGVRAKSLDKNARLVAQPIAGFWCAESLISLYDKLKFEIMLFDSMSSVEDIKRSHVHRWISANALVELFTLNGTRTCRLITFADKRLAGSKDGHYTLDISGERLLLEALRDLRDMTRALFSQLGSSSMSESESAWKNPLETKVLDSSDETLVKQCVALGQNDRQRPRKVDAPSLSLPTWPLKVSSSNQDGF